MTAALRLSTHAVQDLILGPPLPADQILPRSLQRHRHLRLFHEMSLGTLVKEDDLADDIQTATQ